ncbi:MAG: DUF1553 domain-containing protein [Isosphaeraceae bacterium]
MPVRRLLLMLVLLLESASTGRAGGNEIAILPSPVRLVGPNARQSLIVEERNERAWIADRTREARFSVDRASVVRVGSDGVLTPVGNGHARVTAQIGSQLTVLDVSVEQFESDPGWSFRNHVEPVLTRAGCNAGACHGAAAGKNGFRLSLRAYAPELDFDALTRQALGRRIDRSAPAESLVLLKATGALEHGGGARIAPGSRDYGVLAGWIAAGAPAPSPNDPRIIALRVIPEAVEARLGQRQQVIVEAVRSDGRIDDVTPWAKFASTDDSVAKVDESGQVIVEGAGEASVTVWYASLVGRLTVTAPHARPLDARVFRDAPRRNPIDEKNLAKLESLRIPPAPPADDATFLRRAYLDATGTLPPSSEVVAFLADRGADKHARLVDRLLESPAYIDYWSYKWSDLLLVASHKLPQTAVWSFYRFVRSAVERNVPWDQFASSIITAKGSTLRNGAANYFVLHRDPIDLTESSSMAFLGLSLTCARCHNHPMEKWTQDQYYGMASLFSRVQLKDGEGLGDVLVLPAAQGEIRHPRRQMPMPPQPLDAAPVDSASTVDRREAFASWLARPENPYFDRAIVNRVWRNFFGRGIIDPEDDLRATNPPSDEALLNWLVEDFRAHHRDVKHLIRTIMTSAVYARSSVPVEGSASDTRFLSHYPVKRLPAEVILDAIATVTEVPTSFAGYPPGWRSLQLPDSKVESTFLASFGRPERLSTCSCERSSDPSMAQTLHLANGTTINDKLRAEKSVVSKAVAAGTSDDAVVDGLMLAALGRHPTDLERKRLVEALRAAVKGIEDPMARAESRRQAIEDLYWATLTSTEFLFNH